MKIDYVVGATPLDPDEISGLIPSHIVTQTQLNEWEYLNILDVETWVDRQGFSFDDVTTLDFIKRIHKQMFHKTWSWAGVFRDSNKNIGVDKFMIHMSLQNLLNDIRYQVEHDIYSNIELAARFHHRLVSIHPFANGNGRHARMMTDILLLSQGHERFLWGGRKNLSTVSQVRQEYIEALRAADRLDYSLLLKFVLS